MYHILYVASSSRRTKGARAWTESASPGDPFGSTTPTLSKTVLVGVGGTLGADAVANVARPRLPRSDAGVPADAARGPNAGTLTKVASRAAAITTQRMGDHGALLDLVDPEDPNLRPIDDRRREDASLLAEGRDREGGPEHVLEGQLLVPGRIREAFDFLREAPQVLLVRLVDDGDGQPLVRGGRDPDVVVFLDDDFAVLVVDGTVQGRELLEGAEDRLDEKREERQLDSLPLRGLPEVFPQVDELGHVHLLDVREVGRRHVRLRHLLEDPLAEAVDRDPFLAAAGPG